ncbi:hypothetical protein EXIGLDRAFT_784459 [Exidia glandulosa HHB12029]|uniref:Uncharacterized protein n=1 Tax=Exidia glandulosa HHB12029 TaxID=1314781 RepID=A0A166MFZ9_EXIGL|nr:hypothetical protein EXIGLDRAFT_784459 [Exidia glandulosa HHB12029]
MDSCSTDMAILDLALFNGVLLAFGFIHGLGSNNLIQHLSFFDNTNSARPPFPMVADPAALRLWEWPEQKDASPRKLTVIWDLRMHEQLLCFWV